MAARRSWTGSGARISVAFLVAALLAPVCLAGAPGTWSETGAMLKPRNEFPLAALPGNRALAIGGLSIVPVPHGNKTVYLAEAELYDAATGTWTPAGSMSRARAYHQAVTLRDGRVLVMGGDRRCCGPHGDGRALEPCNEALVPRGEHGVAALLLHRDAAEGRARPRGRRV